MAGQPLAFFTPASWPADEAARQARVDSIRHIEAAADPRLAEIVARAAALFGVGVAALSIVDRNRQNWIVRVGTDIDGTTRALSFCGHVVADPGRVLTVRDAASDARFAGNPLVTAGGIRFYAGAPLMLDGSPLGALCVTDTSAHPEPDATTKAELARLAIEASDILADYATRDSDAA